MRSTRAPRVQALRHGIEQGGRRERSEGLPAINRADMAFLYYYFDSCLRFISKRQRHFYSKDKDRPARRVGGFFGLGGAQAFEGANGAGLPVYFLV